MTQHTTGQEVRPAPDDRRKSAQVAQVGDRTNLRTCATPIRVAQVAQVASEGTPIASKTPLWSTLAGSPPMLRIVVHGTPAPEPRPRSGKHGGIYVPATADPWKHQVRAACVAALQVAGLAGADAGRPWLGHPFAVELLFRFRRPACHYGAGRNATRLKPSAPSWHLQTPDGDNLAKSTLDALGAWDDLPPLLWANDSQVVVHTAMKAWAEPTQGEGAIVQVWCIDGQVRP